MQGQPPQYYDPSNPNSNQNNSFPQNQPPVMYGQQPMYQQPQMYQHQQMPGQPMPGQPIMHPGQPMQHPMGQPQPQMMVGPDGNLYPAHPQQQPMIGPPQVYNMGQPGMPGMPQQQVQVKALYQLDQLLMSLPGVFVKQKMDWFEAFSGCERPNEYYVYQRHPSKSEKKKGPKIFKYKEISECCERQFCKGDCKPFDMKVKSEVTGAPNGQVMHCKKEGKCTYYCLNRSEMKCWYNELVHFGGQEHYLGKVFDPWDCVNYTFDIRAGDDENSQIEYIIHGTCCQ